MSQVFSSVLQSRTLDRSELAAWTIFFVCVQIIAAIWQGVFSVMKMKMNSGSNNQQSNQSVGTFKLVKAVIQFVGKCDYWLVPRFKMEKRTSAKCSEKWRIRNAYIKSKFISSTNHIKRDTLWVDMKERKRRDATRIWVCSLFQIFKKGCCWHADSRPTEARAWSIWNGESRGKLARAPRPPTK